MDKDLLKMAVNLASAHVQSNAMIAAHDKGFNVDLVNQATLSKLVLDYYKQLASIND